MDPNARTIPKHEALWQKAAQALDAGDFSWLDDLLKREGVSIVDLLALNGDPVEYLSEALTWTCFTGRTNEARILLDKGVDPTAGVKTGMAAFHWAANRGNVDTVRLLIECNVPLEQKNMYEGTVLNCTLWSAVHEHREQHAAIIEALIAAGAKVDDDALPWWLAQDVPSTETKIRIADALRHAHDP